MSRSLKRVLVRALDLTGLPSLLPHLGGNRMLTPCYHGVVSASKANRREGYENTVSSTEFAQHLEWLGRHYRFVDLAGALEWMERPSPGRPPVLISFDDGYRNNLSLAAPLLLRFGAPAIFFLSTGYIGGERLLWPLELDARLEQSPGMEIGRPEQPQARTTIPAGRAERAALAWQLRLELKGLPNAARLDYLQNLAECTNLDLAGVDHELHDFLSWDEARRLAGLGFDIGSHSCEHPILSRLDAEELRIELQDSKDRIEAELGRAVTTIAYPNGGAADYSPKVVEMAQACGYNSAFAVDEAFQMPWSLAGAAQRYGLSRMIVQGHLPIAQFRFLASGARNLLKRQR